MNFDDSTERVSAHKSFLSAVSDVFGAMFYGELKGRVDVTIIEDIADTFIEFF